jgi:hypothetical protein
LRSSATIRSSSTIKILGVLMMPLPPIRLQFLLVSPWCLCIHSVEEWSTGILEYWSNGLLAAIYRIAFFHYHVIDPFSSFSFLLQAFYELFFYSFILLQYSLAETYSQSPFE